MGTCICIIVLLVPLFLYVLYKYVMEKSLKEKIAWCVVDDSSIRNMMTLLDYIHNAQISVEEKYRIGECEEDFILEILQVYQQELIQHYFNGYLLNYWNLTSKDFFFKTLTIFLLEHTNHTFFNGNELKTNKNQLTDYGVAYYKLYYISQLYCLKLYGENLSPDSVARISANGTKEILDKGDVL